MGPFPTLTDLELGTTSPTEKKRSNVLEEDLVLVEAQLENTKIENRIFYNLETNKNFELLDKCVYKSETFVWESTEVKSVGAEEKVDDSNFKDYLKEFLENYKEHPKDEPKYKQAALEMIQKGNNIFHVSLLDVGFYDATLKGFLNSK